MTELSSLEYNSLTKDFHAAVGLLHSETTKDTGSIPETSIISPLQPSKLEVFKAKMSGATSDLLEEMELIK
ncbi:hypothetical protein JRQ81_017436 [Phrynocephalus forsythii]|uniref:Uncharacterized protein n=1 Tax=Phrynocephalus forsythii TaxID=171643 RepID=A0A9Q1B065_9SAUR|nr:hypothetical protein JRQ81_017436 [Phrynocephalus forsythii]